MTSAVRGDAGADRRDAAPGDGRDETETERLDRNWGELLQEVRVIQTGTQILTGFLLAAAFQQRFTELTPFETGLYLVVVALAVCTTLTGLAPVAVHRALFRRGAKAATVAWGSRFATAALIGVALTLVGVVMLVFFLVGGALAGCIAAGLALGLAAALCITLLRRR